MRKLESFGGTPVITIEINRHEGEMMAVKLTNCSSVH